MDILELDGCTRLTASRSVKTSDVNLKTCHVLWRIELIGESESGKSVQSARPDDDDVFPKNKPIIPDHDDEAKHILTVTKKSHADVT